TYPQVRPLYPSLSGSDRRAGLALTTGFLACVVLGVWPNAWVTAAPPKSWEGRRNQHTSTGISAAVDALRPTHEPFRRMSYWRSSCDQQASAVDENSRVICVGK